MKRLVTFLLLSQLFLGIVYGQGQPLPMAVSGDMTIASGGVMRSVGDVNIRSKSNLDGGSTAANGIGTNGRVDNKGTFVMDQALYIYSNIDRDGLLKNTTDVGVDIPVGKTIAIIKQFPECDPSPGGSLWYTMSFPFEVNHNGITFTDGTSAVYGTNFWVRYYDPERRAIVGNNNYNWVEYDYTLQPTDPGYHPQAPAVKSFDGFKPGVAYQIAMEHPVGSPDLNELIFPARNQTTAEAFLAVENNKTKDLVYVGREIYGDNNSNGWAVIGGLSATSFEMSYDNVTFIGSTTSPTTNYTYGGIHYYDRDLKRFVYLGVLDKKVMSPYVTFYTQIDKTTTGITYESGNLVLDNATPPGWRASNDFNTRDVVVISVTNNDDLGYDRIDLVFDDNSNKEYVPMQDVLKMTNTTADPELWSLNETNGVIHALSINRMPIINNNSEEIKLGVQIKKAGTYTFDIMDMESDLMKNVMLTDHVTGRTTDLLREPYEFTIEETGEFTDRFVLFANKAPVSIENIEDNIYAHIDNDMLTIYNLPAEAAIRVMDINGRMIASGNSHGNQYSARLNAKGVFIVKVIGDQPRVLKVLNK